MNGIGWIVAYRAAATRMGGYTTLVGEDRVIRIPDPDDPAQEIVALRDDPS